MKTRTSPKVFAKVEIKNKRDVIGYIQLVSYMRGNASPHIEFELDENWRNKGIMSQELPKYLKARKEYHPQMIAVVKQDNIASKKVLAKCGFLPIKSFEDKDCFIVDLNLTPDIVEKFIKKIYTEFPNEKAD